VAEYFDILASMAGFSCKELATLNIVKHPKISIKSKASIQQINFDYSGSPKKIILKITIILVKLVEMSLTPFFLTIREKNTLTFKNLIKFQK
jgi:hypothetical protein